MDRRCVIAQRHSQTRVIGGEPVADALQQLVLAEFREWRGSRLRHGLFSSEIEAARSAQADQAAGFRLLRDGGAVYFVARSTTTARRFCARASSVVPAATGLLSA